MFKYLVVAFGPLFDLMFDSVLWMALLFEFEELFDFPGGILHGAQSQIRRWRIIFGRWNIVIVENSWIFRRISESPNANIGRKLFLWERLNSHLNGLPIDLNKLDLMLLINHGKLRERIDVINKKIIVLFGIKGGFPSEKYF